MSDKKVILKKKINNEVFDILPKTSADQVSYGDTNVKEFLDNLDNEYGSTVEASETNGNILINGVETTVYTEPENYNASKISQDSTHKFVTESQITEFESKSSIEVVSEIPENISENNLYLVLQEEDNDEEQ